MTEVTGTPSSISGDESPPVADRTTLADLEFLDVLETVAERAVSAMGAARVRARRPVSDIDVVRNALAQVTEFAEALSTETDIIPGALPDITDAVDELRVEGSVLEPEALVRLANAIGAMRHNAALIRLVEKTAPLVGTLQKDVPPRELEDSILRAIGPDHTVTDDASPAVKKARQGLRTTRDRLVKRLERFAREVASEFEVEGGGVTVREGRFVVPLKREARGRVAGLIHGESSSGATVFFEPEEVVELGNDFRAAQAQERRAVLQLLRTLTGSAREELDGITAGWEMSVRLDDLYARARYALDHAAVVPSLAPAPARLAMRGVRHPLVGGDGGAVPFDLVLDDDDRTLVLSGPNAGGKTVLLKAVGLMSCMIQSGVLPPISEPSEIPLFRRIHTDIGDHQSIAASLSTFTAHLLAIQAILDEADERSLVLLDEIGGGTDPMEGAAVAGAVLLTLNERGSVTVAATHLNQLKELAAATSGMVNASLEFDTETLAPTYRLELGRPGRSYGIAIAKRLGMDRGVVENAEQLLPEALRDFEAVLADLERREQVADRRREELDRQQREQEVLAAALERERADLDRRMEALETAERDLERAGREQARRFLLESRKRVEEALGLARAAVTEATAKEARRLVEEGVSEEAEAIARLEKEAVGKGWKVTGRVSPKASADTPNDAPAAKRTAEEAQRMLAERAATEIDLRGKRAEEAQAALTAALDAAAVADLPDLRVIHGKGTGALRKVVREVLEGDPRVLAFADAEPHLGGSGVTVVELRR